MTLEEAVEFVNDYLAQTSSQLGTASIPKQSCCAECDAELGRHRGWGRCQTHYKKRKRQAIKAACVELLGGKCGRCGGQFPQSVFDFHHRTDKAFSVGKNIKRCSVRSVVGEVMKCTLLCANCHRMEHKDDYI